MPNRPPRFSARKAKVAWKKRASERGMENQKEGQRFSTMNHPPGINPNSFNILLFLLLRLLPILRRLGPEEASEVGRQQERPEVLGEANWLASAAVTRKCYRNYINTPPSSSLRLVIWIRNSCHLNCWCSKCSKLSFYLKAEAFLSDTLKQEIPTAR